MANRNPYESEFEQFRQRFRDFYDRLPNFGGRGPILYVGITAVILVLWLASGVYIVNPGEQGVIRTFGTHTATTVPGLNYHIPWPIQSATVVDVESVRRAEIGFRSRPEATQRILDEALMLTTDENIVEIQMLIQYKVENAADFLFNVENAERVLQTSTEVAVRSTAGTMTIDGIITQERARLQLETRERLSRLMELYGTGLQIMDVRLQVADAPVEVRDAFQEVVRALADKERLVNEAQAYRNDIVPRARGARQEAIQQAAGSAQSRVLSAQGDAERFAAIRQAYEASPSVTRERLHIEAVEEILSHMDIILLDESVTDGGVLPFLPLRDAQRLENPAAGAAGRSEPEGN